ncbi:MAG: hypothetical protein ABIO81_03460 [Ginsengibacter sp.]
MATGLLAGTLDAIAAMINYTINGGKLPSRIFQYIASGAVGTQAFKGGKGMIILGTIFHYIIALLYPIPVLDFPESKFSIKKYDLNSHCIWHFRLACNELNCSANE